MCSTVILTVLSFYNRQYLTDSGHSKERLRQIEKESSQNSKTEMNYPKNLHSGYLLVADYKSNVKVAKRNFLNP